MMPSNRRITLALASSLSLLLAACGSSSGSGASGTLPALDIALSTPGLSTSLEMGGGAQTFYAYFNDATSEFVGDGGNPDNLHTLSVDSTGATGRITLTPDAGQTPGIYEVIFTAGNSHGTVGQPFNFNLLQAGQFTGHPTIIDFPMGGATSKTQTVSLGTRNGIISQSAQAVQLVAPEGSAGVVLGNGSTDNGIVVTPNSGTNTGVITATITIDTSTLSKRTVTDANGTSYSNGIELILTALPEASNGFVPIRYSELVYINPT
jgi:hypothetical protein